MLIKVTTSHFTFSSPADEGHNITPEILEITLKVIDQTIHRGDKASFYVVTQNARHNR